MRRIAVGAGAIWVLLQSLFWTVPPFSDALGHTYPQAKLLLDSNWSLHSVAAGRFVEHPPLVSSIVAAGWAVLGYPILWGHLVSTVFGLVALIGVLKVTRMLTSDLHALCASASVASCSVFFAQATNPYIEIPMLAGLIWAVFFVLRENARGLCVAIVLMTCAKETSLPLAFIIFLFALVQCRARGSKWTLPLAAALGVVPCLAWLLYAASVKGSFLSETIAAASSNGSVATSGAGMAKKFLLAWVQVLLLGLWIPLLFIGGTALRNSKAAFGSAIARALRSPALIFIVSLIVISTVQHGVVSISLNRYYLPAVMLSWIVAWVTVDSMRIKARYLLFGSVVWGVFSYLAPMGYAVSEDSYRGVATTLRHREAARHLPLWTGEDTVVASYPATFELTRPYLGYTDKTIPIADFDAALDIPTGARWVLTGDGQMNGKRLEAKAKATGFVPVRAPGISSRESRLYRRSR